MHALWDLDAMCYEKWEKLIYIVGTIAHAERSADQESSL